MTHPHYAPLITLGNIVTLGTILAAMLVNAMWVGKVTERFENRLGAEEKITAEFTPIIKELVREGIKTEGRLKEGEAVRASRVPLLDSMISNVNVINSRMDALNKAIMEGRDVNRETSSAIRELSKEVANLREVVAGLKATLQNRGR
jgi:hypothetical protein